MLHAMNAEPREWFITLVAYNTVPPTPGLENAKLSVVNADGVPLRSGGTAMRGGNDRIVWNVEFEEVGNGGPPAKLKLVIPAESRDRDPLQVRPGAQGRCCRRGQLT